MGKWDSPPPRSISTLYTISLSQLLSPDTLSHTYRQNCCKVLHQGILSLLFQVNKGALHSQCNLSSVSFLHKKKKSQKRNERSEKVVVVSNLQAAGLPEHPEFGTEARGSWQGPFSPGSVWHKQKHRSISRTIYKPCIPTLCSPLSNWLACSFIIFSEL